MSKKQTKPKPLSVLESYYLNSMLEKQIHFRKEWFKFFGLKRNQFYARLKRPQIVDLQLWQIVNDVLIFPDWIMSEFENQNKEKLKEIEVYEMPEHYKKDFVLNQFSTII